MADVEPGDLLFDEQGQSCTVLAVSNVMYDHDVYEVEFDDGTTIKADADHRWLTFTKADRLALLARTDEWRAARRAKRPLRGTGKRPDLDERNRSISTVPKPVSGAVRTTTEIAGSVLDCGRTNHSVVVAKPLVIPESILPLDPYVLGAWLGDGTSAGQGFSTADDEVLEHIRAAGYEVIKWAGKYAYGIKGIKSALRRLDVLSDKHIPHTYLWASESQRWALLAGLMDTDGTALPSGSCEFYSTNQRLAGDVWQLLQSLGIKCSVRTGRAMLNGKDCGEKYRIKFTTARPVFKLTRKLQRQVTKERGTQSWRYIVSCRRIASEPVKCVTVDSPSHLYLAGRQMVPTHNSDLLLGLALTAHTNSIIFRRTYNQFRGEGGLIQRCSNVVGSRGMFVGRLNGWRVKDSGKTVQFGAVETMADLGKWRGLPHDLKAFDELPEFLEAQYLFLMGWLRTINPMQRTRTVGAGNPPLSMEGEWVIRRWAPWLDRQHANPARPGELRWFARLDDKDVEVESSALIVRGDETIQPKSRTFIPASLKDNQFLANSDYASTLQGLTEPLRSQLLYGDFSIGLKDDPWQCIPTSWVDAAMRRWTAQKPDEPATCSGLDVARGGAAKTVLAQRWSSWFAPLDRYAGKDTPDGQEGRRIVIQANALGGPCNVDVIGPGAAVVDLAREVNANVVPVNFGAGTKRRDRTNLLKFVNVRAFAYWSFREALDPEKGDEVALPPDAELRSDLCAARWMVRVNGIQIEAKDDIIARLGRSPDAGDAVVLAAMPPLHAEVTFA